MIVKVIPAAVPPKLKIYGDQRNVLFLITKGRNRDWQTALGREIIQALRRPSSCGLPVCPAAPEGALPTRARPESEGHGESCTEGFRSQALKWHLALLLPFYCLELSCLATSPWQTLSSFRWLLPDKRTLRESAIPALSVYGLAPFFLSWGKGLQ